MTQILKGAIYARVSSEQQAQAGTIASQLAALKERVASDGLQLDDACCFVDDGYSGASLVRPALERLRDLAATGAIDRLYVHSPDRLARKYAYQVLLVDEFRRCGVELFFLNHQLGRTPEEDLLLQVQGMVAEYERAKILERSRRGKLHAARKGSVNVLSGAPYGYRYVSSQDGAGEARYEVVFEQAQIVKQIYEWVGRERVSIGEVCRRLKHQNVPSCRGKSYWDRTSVWGILKNPAYKGAAAFGKTHVGELRAALRLQRGSRGRRPHSVSDTPREEWLHIPVPALVSGELFDAVQEQLAENRHRARQRARGARYLLQGLLVCQCCGYACYGKPVSHSAAKGGRRYSYYRCIGTDAYRFGGQRACSNKQVRTDMLEEAVWEDVADLLTHPQRIEAEYQRRMSNPQRTNAAADLAEIIGKLKGGMARLVDAYSEGLLEKDEFEPRIRRARERLEKLEQQREAQADHEAQQRELALVIGRLGEFAERVQTGLVACDWSVRRDIVRALVKRIEIGKDAVRVVYRVNPGPFADGPARGQRKSLQHCWRGDFAVAGERVPALCARSVGSRVAQEVRVRRCGHRSLRGRLRHGVPSPHGG